jgi:hypothetical protein
MGKRKMRELDNPGQGGNTDVDIADTAIQLGGAREGCFESITSELW